MRKILAINGSYRDDGITDQAVDVLAAKLSELGLTVETVLLRDHPIKFCLNCRECTQQAGEHPGECVQHDGMHELVTKIEQADGFILASPTNFSSVTALFKRFMERLVVFAYWPWGKPAPRYRKDKAPRKPAVLVSSCAAPGILGRWLYHSRWQLRNTARVIGADVVGTLFTGLIADERSKRLPARARRKIDRLTKKLAQ